METVVEEGKILVIPRSKRLRGGLSFPGDAHLSMFATAIASLCAEPTRLENLPDAPWFMEFRAALEAWGATFESVTGHEGSWMVRGGKLHPASGPIPVRHEIAALILAGIGSGLNLGADFRFDPIAIPTDTVNLLNSIFPPSPTMLRQAQHGAVGEGLGVRVHPKASGICKPFEMKWDEGLAKIALLFHHLAAGRGLELHLRRPGSDLLENTLRQFGVDVKVESDEDKNADELTRRIARQLRTAGKEITVTRVKLPGTPPVPPAGGWGVPGDVGEASVAALAAVLIKGSDLTLEHVLLNTGRSAFFAALRRMGADIEVVHRKERQGEAMGILRARSSGLIGKRFDAETLADLRDEVFLLLLAAAFAEGESVFRDLEYLRAGDTDLLNGFIAALKDIGVEIGEFEGGLVIRGKSECDGGSHDSLGHPGLAVAYAVLALKSHGSSTLAGSEALAWRFPGMLTRLKEAAERTG